MLTRLRQRFFRRVERAQFQAIQLVSVKRTYLERRDKNRFRELVDIPKEIELSEEQTKLIEYGKCLDFQQRRASWGFDLANLRSNFDRVNVQDDYVTLYKAVQNYRFQQLLKDCK
jgi:hypothetical protein